MTRSQSSTIPFQFAPGIQRDSTQFDSNACVDGQWVRWYDNAPRKMNGYQLIIPGTTEKIRSLYSVDRQNNTDIYIGRQSGLHFANITPSLIVTPEVDRTPTTYNVVDNNIWEFDSMTVIDSSHVVYSYLVAFVSPQDIDLLNETPGQTFIGEIASTSPLVEISGANFTGGIVVLTPYLIGYGANGVIYYSDTNNPPTFPSTNYTVVANTPKIVYAVPVRNDTTPTLLVWGVDKLVRATFISESDGFNTVVLDDNISVLSNRCIVLYNSIWYWIGQTQFYSYDGTVQRQRNTMSTDYFFNNLNRQFQSRCFAETNRRFGEIWYHWPSGNNTECSNVLIYNVDSDVWYDTAFLFRIASYEASALLPYPIMSDANTELNLSVPTDDPDSTYGVWLHEYGLDKTLYNRTEAIKSYFRSKIFTLFEGNPQSDRNSVLMRFEPDFVLTGSLYITLYLQAHPKTPPFLSETFVITDETEKLDFDNVIRKGRLWSLYIESNEEGGFYQMGKPLITIEVGNDRPEPTNSVT